MRVSILGCGHVGLVTGACLADVGHEVMCTDNDAAKVGTLEQGGLPFYEPELAGIIDRNLPAQRLSFTRNLGEAVRFGDVIFICVGTPPLRNGDADLAAMDAAAKLIVTESQTSKLVVEKSTVPAQTGQRLKQALTANQPCGPLFESHPIPNSCARERPFLTFCIPSGSSSECRTRLRNFNCARSTHPSWSGVSRVPYINRLVPKRRRPFSSSRTSTAPSSSSTRATRF